LQIIFHI